MFETLHSGEAVEIDIVQGEDFEQTWVILDENADPIPFVANGWEARAAIISAARTGAMVNEEMTVTLADDGSITVRASRAQTLSLPVGSHLWTLMLIVPGTGYYNAIFNPPCRIHAGAVKSSE